MQAAPVIAKLSRPILRDVEPRPRLFERLDGLRTASSAVWLGAPAGSGKTSLVVSYLETRGVPAVWYRIAERDQHVEELFFYLRLAGETLPDGNRSRLELPLFSPTVDVARFARRFFDTLFSSLPRGAVLVFDDYHSAIVGPLWQAAFERALAGIPAGVNVLVLSRQSPPASLARPLAHGELGVLESNELLLTAPETAALAKRRLGKQRKLAAAQLTQIHSTTGGWAAGISLLLRSANEANVSALSSRSVEPVFDYLANAVFDELSPDTQRLLLHASFLQRFSLPELQQLAEVDGTSELVSLYRSGFFIESDGTQEELFRFHPLFRAFLSHRASRVYDPLELGRIRGRAAALLQSGGRNEEAFELLVMNDEPAALVDLVLAGAPALFAQGRTAVLEEWIGALPPGAVAASAWLSYWQAACLVTAQPSNSLQAFENALARFEAENDGNGAYLAWAGAVQALTYEERGYHRLEQWLERLTELERFGPSFDSAETGAAVVSSLLMGLTMAGAESSVLEHWIGKALSLSEKAQDPSVRVMTASVVVLNYAMRGDSTLASTWLERLQRYTAGSSMALLGQVAIRAASATLAWHQGHSGAALAASIEGVELLGSNHVPMWQVALLVFGCMAAIDLGDGPSGERLMGRLAELARAGNPLDEAAYQFVRSREALSRGELRRALVAIELSNDCARVAGFGHGLAIGTLTAGYLRLELGDEAGGRELLAELQAMELAHRRRDLRYWRLLIEADHFLQQGERARCLTLLREALATGRELEVYGLHAPTAARAAELFRLALEHDIETEYVRTLVRRRQLFRYAAPLALTSWPWPVRIRTLGGLEVAVEDQPLALGRARIPLQLLRVLAAEPTQRVAISRVLSWLWPDADGDNANHTFEMGVLRLRNQLGDIGRQALRVERGQMSLDVTICWTDTASLSALMSEIASLEPIHSGLQLERVRTLCGRLKSLYRGPFADEDDAGSPLADYGRILQLKVATAARELGSCLFRLGERAESDALYLTLIERDPLLDALLAPAVEALARAGRHAEARLMMDARRRRPEPISPVDLSQAEEALRRAGPTG